LLEERECQRIGLTFKYVGSIRAGARVGAVPRGYVARLRIFESPCMIA
jgi:hypothetical protein